MDPKNIEQLRSWIASRQWYQTMTLSSGLRIEGKAPTHLRERYLKDETFAGKSVIDVGCNSGQFCLYVKKRGAQKVVGVDLAAERLEEAKILAAAEKLPVEFRRQNLFDVPKEERYDVVFCFAVVTEIQDLLGALDVLKRLTQETLYLELDLAKPLLHLSASWFKRSSRADRTKGFAEVRSSHGKLVFSPSLSALKEFFGPKYEVTLLGWGARYDMVRIRRS